MSGTESPLRQVRIALFGQLRVESAGVVLSRFGTQKTAALLAHLAFHHPRSQRREVLLELLWPDCPEAAARNSLSTSLWTLRQHLGPTGIPGAELVQGDRLSLWLCPRRVTTDVAAFEAAARAVRDAGNAAPPLDLLRAAVELYQGELLREHYEDWILTEQTRLAGLYRQLQARLCDRLEAAGDSAAALAYASDAVRLEPLDQAARLRLMRLYALAGQPESALTHYRELERLLRRELDAPPSPEIQQLARQIAAGARPAAVRAARPEPARTAPVPAGDNHPSAGQEAVGGAVPPDCGQYIERPVDGQFAQAMARRDSIILVRGPRQTGKSSLLARGLYRMRAAGTLVGFTDLQTFSSAELESPERFYRALAASLAEQLDPVPPPEAAWEESGGPALSLRRYLRRSVLPAAGRPVVWGLDEVDRLFTCPFSSDVFGLFRSWHNERALDPEGPFRHLTLVLCYATEAHLFVRDLNQSPFNVGTRLRLGDFTLEEVGELNARYGGPLASSGEVRALQELFGGQPFLVRAALRELSERRCGIQALSASALDDEGPFAEHLHRMLVALSREPALMVVMRRILEGGACPDEDSYYRLRSAGLVVGEGPDRVRVRCTLYQRFLARALR